MSLAFVPFSGGIANFISGVNYSVGHCTSNIPLATLGADPSSTLVYSNYFHIPMACFLRDLFVSIAGSATIGGSAGNSFTATIYTASSATPSTFLPTSLSTVIDFSTGSTFALNSDTTHSVSISQGDLIALVVTPNFSQFIVQGISVGGSVHITSS